MPGALGGWTGNEECPSTGWVVISTVQLGTLHVRRETYGKIQKEDNEKGNRKKILAQENHGRMAVELAWNPATEGSKLFFCHLLLNGLE